VPRPALEESGRKRSKVTELRMSKDGSRILFVLCLTLLMCAVSALLALRKLRTADPADIF
jgi:putative ABC transport system permease protein